MMRNLLIVLLIIKAFHLSAQTDTLLRQNIDSIQIFATRLAIPLQQQPFAISQYRASIIQQSRQQLSLQEFISHIPGLFSLNAQNYAQDLRISIRGFGARSAFGIRGIKIIVDGIPETTPDGQGQLDNLNLGIIEKIEVLKGSSSTLYGNASGGVININTLSDFKQNFLEAGLTFGSYHLQQYQLKGGWQREDTRIIGQVSHTQTDGYRQQSGVESTNVNLRVLHDFSKQAKLNFQINYTNSPQADDAGGLNLESAMADRRQARDRNVLFQTGEAIEQLKLGAAYNYDLNKNSALNFYGFYSNRGFYGLLPFEFGGIVDLSRNYWGQGGHYKFKKIFNHYVGTFQIGYEYADQRDTRQRFINLEGDAGALTLNQLESFQNIGVYYLIKADFNRFSAQAGLRFDNNQLQVKDYFLDNGDASDQIDLQAFSYSIALNHASNQYLNIYLNSRYSYETPSLSELSADPENGGGFNLNLKPQEAYTQEIGLRGNWSKHANFDATLFYISTKNDLVPYELEAFPDRTFYQNAGSTNRFGLELSAEYFFTKNFSISSSYTYSDFKYDTYFSNNDNFSGNLLPAIPKHTCSILATYQQSSGLQLRTQGRYIGTLFTNDSNSVSVDDYFLLDANIGYQIQLKKVKVFPFFGLNNLLNIEYFDNIRINAFGNRFYEPGAEFNVYGGVRFKL